MKKSFLRRAIWSTVLLCTVTTVTFFLLFFPKNYPDDTLRLADHATTFIQQLTLPLKLARFSLLPPDTAILMPVYNVRVSSVANTWQAPRDGVRTHDGQDIFAARGTPVFSGTNGYVRRMRVTELGGINVMITGAGGRRYYYAHLDRFPEGLHVGQYVTIDTIVGFVGNTGNAITTPPHLHFGMYEGRQAMDPLPLLLDRW